MKVCVTGPGAQETDAPFLMTRNQRHCAWSSTRFHFNCAGACNTNRRLGRTNVGLRRAISRARRRSHSRPEVGSGCTPVTVIPQAGSCRKTRGARSPAAAVRRGKHSTGRTPGEMAELALIDHPGGHDPERCFTAPCGSTNPGLRESLIRLQIAVRQSTYQHNVNETSRPRV